MRAVEVKGRKVRYAAIGIGWITQAHFLPGVAHTGNSELAALVTGDVEKAAKVGAKYGISQNIYKYEDLDNLLASGKIDAVYLATPNVDHAAVAIKVLNAGVHLLLEKPMAASVLECEQILSAQESTGAKLMVAYRLHHEPGTLSAIERVRNGDIGRVVAFNSTFTQSVDGANHRAKHGYWGGPVPDMGVYCINAARNLFGAEPEEVSATGVQTSERFNFEDTVAVTMKFPGKRVASFLCSYNAGDVDDYHIVGEKGDLFSQPGYGVGVQMEHAITVEGKKMTEKCEKTDHFGGQTKYFSECILKDHPPEADGEEGLLDVRVLAAVEESLKTNRPVALKPYARKKRPTMKQVQQLPPVKEPELVKSHSPEEGQ